MQSQWKKIHTALFASVLTLVATLTSTQLLALEDGLYVFPEVPNQYGVVLSNGAIYQGFVFSIDPEDTGWDELIGSAVDSSTVRIIDGGVGDDRIKIFEVNETPNDIRVVQKACRDYPDNSGGCSPFPEEGLKFSMLMPANGQLKGIFATQWGARFVIFESDGIVVALSFESEDTLSEKNIVSAYTANINSSLRISNITEVVAPYDEDDEFNFTMEWQISDFENPQLEVLISDCSSSGSAIDCAEIETYLTYVTRVF